MSKSRKKNIIFSIVIPAFNEEKYLPACLSSVKNQSFDKNKYEIIVVNNNSTDNTGKIAAELGIKLVRQTKKGISYARHAGILKAKGKYICWLDADCEAPQEWLINIYQSICKNKSAVAIAGTIFVKNKSITNFLINYVYIPFFDLINFFCIRFFKRPVDIFAGNFIFSKSIYHKIGGLKYKDFCFSDQLGFVRRLNKYGSIVSDKKIRVFTSDRRNKGNFIRFYLIDIIGKYYLGYFLFRLGIKIKTQRKDYR